MLYHAMIATERDSVKLLVINNLSSGPGDGAIFDFIRSIARDGTEISIRSTDGTTDLATLLEDATSFDAVVASGGDGTVAAICHLLAYTGIPILPFPAGTANLFVLNLESPLEPHALAKLVTNGYTHDFDLAEIEVANEKFGFGIMAGCGYDAKIMHDAEAGKHLIGQTAYLSAAFMNPTPQVSHFTIDLDDETIECDGIDVIVANFAKIQFEITLSPECSPCDGLLDVIILKTQTALELIPSFLVKLFDHNSDMPEKTDVLEIHRSKSVHVVADPPLEVEYDGELTGLTTPFEAHVLPNAVSFYVSEDGRSLFESNSASSA